MSDSRRNRMLSTVQEMFEMIKHSPEGNTLDASGVPLRLTRMAERIFSPDIQITVPGRGPHVFSGGKAAYYAYHAERLRKTEGALRLELLDILVGESHAAGLIRYNDERDGVKFSWLRVNAYWFNEDGSQITEIRTFEHDQHGVDEWYSASLGPK